MEIVLQYGLYSCMDVSLGDKLMFLGPSIGEHSGCKKRNVRKVETLQTDCEVHACMPSVLHSQRMRLYHAYRYSPIRPRKLKEKKAVHIGHSILLFGIDFARIGKVTRNERY